MSEKSKSWPAYRPQDFEAKWQQLWEQEGLHLAQEHSDRPKFSCLDFFPYPSGEGLHVGHCRNYVPTDVVSRFKRMQGFNVLHPMGWDAFGEPAEQYAISHGIHPRLTTDSNTANFRRQMRMIGTSYDWTREIDSSQPEYYRWTQWFFLQLYRRGLAYRDANWQWWCPVCLTTLSKNEVNEGVCWRGHSGVTRREIPAWYFRITAYAEELLSGLDVIDWPERIKAMQRNWIGRSDGCLINFRMEDRTQVPVFTTRPDTLFGATFFLLAPEHPLVDRMTSPEQQAAVTAYRSMALGKSEIERMSVSDQKSGVFTGSFVIHPLSGDRIPVWVADYVLYSYGTGAVMGVPAHDERDFAFARQFDLPIRQVIQPETAHGDDEHLAAYQGEGRMINSPGFDGLDSVHGGEAVTAYLEKHELGGRRVQYRMRDWLISRQRYWGTPIPIVYCEQCGEQPVPEEQLPVILPPMENFQPDGSGRSPLARLPEFLNTTCPACGGRAQRETDTMGGFACSSWYFLRYTSPHYAAGPFEASAMQYWMPVDLYVGGAEHAVLHLLYARFWIKVLADAGLVPFREPFVKLMNQGQLLGLDGQRMSKSRGNVITPDEMVAAYGADALRVNEMFMAPFEQDVAWSTEGINGARRFLQRVWTLYETSYAASSSAHAEDPALLRLLHQTIRHISERIESFRLNTMISTLMEFSNELVDRQRQNRWQTRTFHQSLDVFLKLLSPAAPYIAEELWSLTGHPGRVHQQPWPTWDARLAQDVQIEIGIQVDGKVRDTIAIGVEEGEEDVWNRARALPKIQSHLSDRDVIRIYYIPGRNLNIVTRPKVADK